MTTFLFKTEPDDYSYQDLVKDRKTTWTGVANPAALAHIRTARTGDQVFIYHTSDEKAIVGLARIVSDPRPDPAKPGVNSRGETAFPVVDLEPLKPAKTPTTLAAIKADPRFKDFALVRIPRLSVMPVPATLDKALRSLAGL